MTSILVTDGEERSALAIVRSLGRRGYRVIVCSPRRASLAGGSKYAHAEALIASPLLQPVAFVADVRALIAKWQIDVLIPVSEASLLALLPERDSLPVSLPFPPYEAFSGISNKAAVLRAAAEVGIQTPQQHVIETPADAHTLTSEKLHFPAVLKPARSVISENGTRMKSAVLHVEDRATLHARLAAVPRAAYPVMLQERIVGAGLGVFVLLWKGKLIAHFFHRRIREKPPSGGVSVYCESVAPNQELLERSLALLKRFDWTGVAMVEYKLDGATGTPYLMEINGRFWGSLQLAIDAGVDFPALLAALATEQSPNPVLSYRVGVRSRWLWGDVDQLMGRLLHSKAELALASDMPGRLRGIADFCVAFAHGRNEVLRVTDPVPALRETRDWLRGAF